MSGTTCYGCDGEWPDEEVMHPELNEYFITVCRECNTQSGCPKCFVELAPEYGGIDDRGQWWCNSHYDLASEWEKNSRWRINTEMMFAPDKDADGVTIYYQNAEDYVREDHKLRRCGPRK